MATFTSISTLMSRFWRSFRSSGMTSSRQRTSGLRSSLLPRLWGRAMADQSGLKFSHCPVSILTSIKISTLRQLSSSTRSRPTCSSFSRLSCSNRSKTALRSRSHPTAIQTSTQTGLASHLTKIQIYPRLRSKPLIRRRSLKPKLQARCKSTQVKPMKLSTYKLRQPQKRCQRKRGPRWFLSGLKWSRWSRKTDLKLSRLT